MHCAKARNFIHGRVYTYNSSSRLNLKRERIGLRYRELPLFSGRPGIRAGGSWKITSLGRVWMGTAQCEWMIVDLINKLRLDLVRDQKNVVWYIVILWKTGKCFSTNIYLFHKSHVSFSLSFRNLGNYEDSWNNTRLKDWDRKVHVIRSH